MTKTHEVAAAMVELPPPTASAYVEMYEGISADRCEDLGCWEAPPGEPPHDGHEHAHEGPRVFRRYPSDTLTLTDSLTAVLVATTAVLLHEGVEGGEKIGHD